MNCGTSYTHYLTVPRDEVQDLPFEMTRRNAFPPMGQSNLKIDPSILRQLFADSSRTSYLTPNASVTRLSPHLNTRFDGIKPHEPLPLQQPVRLSVWIGPHTTNDPEDVKSEHSILNTTTAVSSRPVEFPLPPESPRLTFRVRVDADPEVWQVDTVQPILTVVPPAQTMEEAVFVLTAQIAGRDKLHISVERLDTGIVVQHIWLPVMVVEQDEKPAQSSATLRVTEPERTVTGLEHNSHKPKALFVRHKVGQPDANAMPARRSALRAAQATPLEVDPDEPRVLSLPLDNVILTRRSVQLVLQSGRDPESFRMVINADLPSGRIYDMYTLPINGAALQNATLRLRQELQKIVYHEMHNGLDSAFPFANTETLTVDKQIAREAVVPLADAGQQVWELLFHGPRAPQGLKEFAIALRDLPLGSTVQIVIESQHFIVPWAMLYDSPDLVTAETLDWKHFWGYRYILDVLPPGRYPNPAIEPIPASIHLLLNNDTNLHAFTSAQEQFVQAQPSAFRPQVAWGTQAVRQALTQQVDAALLYLYCHGTHVSGAVQAGALAGESALYFSGNERIRLTDLKRLLRAPFASHPLVMLNACEGATQDAFFYDGFMPFFIEERGARGFIGTEVKAPQLLAHDFALKFLQEFAAGRQVGEILWRLRRHYLDEHHNILGFNYTLYGLDEIQLATAGARERTDR